MTIELLPAASRKTMPWRNGGGVTTEIAIEPAEAALDDFTWRISMAEVAQAGPFSSFAGIDRVLTVLEGSLLLRFAGGDSVLRAAGGAPFAFAGDAACTGVPIAGVVRDLNVMTRRGRARAEVRYGRHVQLGAEELGVVLALSACAARSGDAHFALEAWDGLRVGGGREVRLTATGICVVVRGGLG